MSDKPMSEFEKKQLFATRATAAATVVAAGHAAAAADRLKEMQRDAQRANVANLKLKAIELEMAAEENSRREKEARRQEALRNEQASKEDIQRQFVKDVMWLERSDAAGKFEYLVPRVRDKFVEQFGAALLAECMSKVREVSPLVTVASKECDFAKTRLEEAKREQTRTNIRLSEAADKLLKAAEELSAADSIKESAKKGFDRAKAKSEEPFNLGNYYLLGLGIACLMLARGCSRVFLSGGNFLGSAGTVGQYPLEGGNLAVCLLWILVGITFMACVYFGVGRWQKRRKGAVAKMRQLDDQLAKVSEKFGEKQKRQQEAQREHEAAENDTKEERESAEIDCKIAESELKACVGRLDDARILAEEERREALRNDVRELFREKTENGTASSILFRLIEAAQEEYPPLCRLEPTSLDPEVIKSYIRSGEKYVV